MSAPCGKCPHCAAPSHVPTDRRECSTKSPCIVLAGNPNCGKTSLFNALTGARQKVGNRPGVTVEEKEAELRYRGVSYRLIDLPGTYALTDYSQEETVARERITSDDIDLIVNVLDATCPERGLFFTLQLLALQKPTVVVLNLSDIAAHRSISIDIERMASLLGVPAVAVSARSGQGLDKMLCAVSDACSHKTAPQWNDSTLRRKTCIEIADSPDAILSCVDTISSRTVRRAAKGKDATDSADAVLLHPLWGAVFLLCVLAATFFLTFTVGNLFKNMLSDLFTFLSDIARTHMHDVCAPDWLISFALDGALVGVCGILSFLPNLFFLYVILACLEDSGYMARAAYLADGLTARLGLSGKAIIPMLLGYGCTVPAVLATKTLEDVAQRRRTMLLLPFLSCSARLPVYILLADAFFGQYAPLAACSMYAVGTGIAVLLARFTEGHAADAASPLLIELPDFRMPDPKTVTRDVARKLREYLTKAGTTVFLASLAVWILLHIGTAGPTADISRSFAAQIGRCVSPLLSVCGLGQWQTAVALISGVAAKEVVVSSLFVLYGVTGGTVAHTSLHTALECAGFTSVNAYALMLFVLLYVPCVATVSAIRHESGSRSFTVRTVLCSLLTAFAVSALFYQATRLILS